MGYFSKHLQGYGKLNTILGICNFPARIGVFYLEVIFHQGIASFKFFLARFARSVYNKQQLNLLVACATNSIFLLYMNAFYVRGMLF